MNLLVFLNQIIPTLQFKCKDNVTEPIFDYLPQLDYDLGAVMDFDISHDDLGTKVTMLDTVCQIFCPAKKKRQGWNMYKFMAKTSLKDWMYMYDLAEEIIDSISEGQEYDVDQMIEMADQKVKPGRHRKMTKRIKCNLVQFKNDNEEIEKHTKACQNQNDIGKLDISFKEHVETILKDKPLDDKKMNRKRRKKRILEKELEFEIRELRKELHHRKYIGKTAILDFIQKTTIVEIVKYLFELDLFRIIKEIESRGLNTIGHILKKHEKIKDSEIVEFISDPSNFEKFNFRSHDFSHLNVSLDDLSEISEYLNNLSEELRPLFRFFTRQGITTKIEILNKDHYDELKYWIANIGMLSIIGSDKDTESEDKSFLADDFNGHGKEYQENAKEKDPQDESYEYDVSWKQSKVSANSFLKSFSRSMLGCFESEDEGLVDNDSKSRRKRNNGNLLQDRCINNLCDYKEAVEAIRNGNDEAVYQLYGHNYKHIKTNLKFVASANSQPISQRRKRATTDIPDKTKYTEQHAMDVLKLALYPCEFYHSVYSKGTANSNLCANSGFDSECQVTTWLTKICNCVSQLVEGEYCDQCGDKCTYRNSNPEFPRGICVFKSGKPTTCQCQNAIVVSDYAGLGQDDTFSALYKSKSTFCDSEVAICQTNDNFCDTETTNCQTVPGQGYKCVCKNPNHVPDSLYSCVDEKIQNDSTWAETSTQSISTTNFQIGNTTTSKSIANSLPSTISGVIPVSSTVKNTMASTKETSTISSDTTTLNFTAKPNNATSTMSPSDTLMSSRSIVIILVIIVILVAVIFSLHKLASPKKIIQEPKPSNFGEEETKSQKPEGDLKKRW